MTGKTKITAAILLVLGVGILCIAPGYIEKARESEARTNIASLASSLRAFHSQYSKYTDNFETLHFAPEGQLRYHLFLSPDKICPGVRSKLKENQLPFADKDNYRIVAIGYNSLFIQELDKPLIHEEIQVSLKELFCDDKGNR